MLVPDLVAQIVRLDVGDTRITGGGIALVRDNTFQGYDNVSSQQGRHSIKFGGEALQVQYNRYEAPNALANFKGFLSEESMFFSV